jgi:predicted HicB family RNase H-like nuclease
VNRAGEQQVVVRLPPELYAQAVERAKQDERSLAQLIRWACRSYIAAHRD